MSTTKIVSVEATHPFIVRGVYARSIFRQALTIDEIYQCLTQQTSVTEHMPDGTTKRLDLSNYKDVSVKQPEVKTPMVLSSLKILLRISASEKPLLCKFIICSCQFFRFESLALSCSYAFS